jgi:hypothetical protein
LAENIFSLHVRDPTNLYFASAFVGKGFRLIAKGTIRTHFCCAASRLHDFKTVYIAFTKWFWKNRNGVLKSLNFDTLFRANGCSVILFGVTEFPESFSPKRFSGTRDGVHFFCAATTRLPARPNKN